MKNTHVRSGISHSFTLDGSERQTFYLAASAVLIFFLVGLVRHNIERISKPVKQVVVEQDVERAILAKASKKRSSSRLTSIILYRFANNRHYLLGSGILYRDQYGEAIKTSRHIFWGDFGEMEVVYRRLHPMDNFISFGISGIVPDTNQLTPVDALPDVVTLRTGTRRPIRSISSRNPHDKVTITSINLSAVRMIVRSAVSDEKVEIIGNVFCLKDPVEYVLMDYSNMKGESGSGFEDEDGMVYITRGHVITSEVSEDLRKKLPQKDTLTIALGPIKI